MNYNFTPQQEQIFMFYQKSFILYDVGENYYKNLWKEISSLSPEAYEEKRYSLSQEAFLEVLQVLMQMESRFQSL